MIETFVYFIDWNFCIFRVLGEYVMIETLVYLEWRAREGTVNRINFFFFWYILIIFYFSPLFSPFIPFHPNIELGIRCIQTPNNNQLC